MDKLTIERNNSCQEQEEGERKEGLSSFLFCPHQGCWVSWDEKRGPLFIEGKGTL
jgi:hypothetical protein